jgi:hypothetical protein
MRVLLLVVVLCLTPVLGFAQVDTVLTDRLGWTQAMSAAEQPSITFAAFVDGVRVTTALAATCTVTATPDTYDCVASYPAMTPGPHTIELIAIRTEGTLVVESGRSAPFSIRLVVGPAVPGNLHNVRGGGS